MLLQYFLLKYILGIGSVTMANSAKNATTSYFICMASMILGVITAVTMTIFIGTCLNVFRLHNTKRTVKEAIVHQATFLNLAPEVMCSYSLIVYVHNYCMTIRVSEFSNKRNLKN